MDAASSLGSGCSKNRVLLLPFPVQGHLNPMFHLGALLRSQGFSITIIHTTFNAPDPSKHPHFQFHPIAESFSIDSTVYDPVSFVLSMNDCITTPLKESLRSLASMSMPESIASCLIADSLMTSATEVARQFGLPVITLRTGSAACFCVYSVFATLWEKTNGCLPIKGDNSDDVVPEIPPFRWKDLPRFEMSSPNGSYKLISQLVKNVGCTSALILNTFEELEPNEIETIAEELQHQIPIFPVGPLHKLSPSDHTTHDLLVQDRTCIDWLDVKAPGSVLYVSFGSTARFSGEGLLEIAWGLANSGWNFLWVIRPGSVLEGSVAALMDEQSSFTEVTRERGKVVKWAPQREVLRHPSVGGFWTHCGWNSTLESVCEGVPMLCCPYFADQMLNARVVDHVWKVGITVDGLLERDTIEKAVRRLMGDDEGGEGREMRRRAGELKDMAALSMDINGGSSIRNLDKLVHFISSLSNDN